MTPKTVVKNIVKALNELKGHDILTLDIRKITSIADYMIIASGRSDRQVKALANKVIDTAKKKKIAVLGVEGQQKGEWILVDLGDVIVHVMHPETRAYYQLEKLWSSEQQEVRRVSSQ